MNSLSFGALQSKIHALSRVVESRLLMETAKLRRHCPNRSGFPGRPRPFHHFWHNWPVQQRQANTWSFFGEGIIFERIETLQLYNNRLYQIKSHFRFKNEYTLNRLVLRRSPHHPTDLAIENVWNVFAMNSLSNVLHFCRQKANSPINCYDLLFIPFSEGHRDFPWEI